MRRVNVFALIESLPKEVWKIALDPGEVWRGEIIFLPPHPRAGEILTFPPRESRTEIIRRDLYPLLKNEPQEFLPCIWIGVAEITPPSPLQKNGETKRSVNVTYYRGGYWLERYQDVGEGISEITEVGLSIYV